MLVQQRSPEDLYSAFATNVMTIHSDVKDFSSAFQDDRFRQVLKKAEETRAQSSEDIPGWRVTEHEDWLDVCNVDSPMDIALAGANGADPDASQPMTTDLEDLRTAVEEFKGGNHSVDISLDEHFRTIKV